MKLRDTFASYSLVSRMPLQNLINNLGHSDIRTTQIYLQAVPRVKSKEIKKIFDDWR